MATALGSTQKRGITIKMTNINESVGNFKPNAEGNYISYGLRSLSGISYDFIQKIIENRPFKTFEEFMIKTEPNKAQALALIKAGAFQEIDSQNRKLTLAKYAKFTTNKRKNLTIAQLPILISAGLLPEELEKEKRVYEFNRYIKEILIKSGEVIRLDERAQNFLVALGAELLMTPLGEWVVMGQDGWKKYYDSSMVPVREFLKSNKPDLLQNIFLIEMFELFDEYGGEESLGRWEMESMNFYYTEHELKNLDYKTYGISKYGSLPREPKKQNLGRYSIFDLSIIVGTIIGKNKVKGTLDLLTPEGDVVLIKMYKGDFSFWDKQISEQDGSGKKTVVEKSFFVRGNKLLLTGFRRNDQFIPRTYASSPSPKIGLITELKEDGSITMKTGRAVS